MESNKVCFKMIERELVKLRKNLKSIDAWRAEIEVINKKMSAYKSGGFSLGSKSQATVTLDDILARDETKLNTLESNIDYTQYKLKEYKAFLYLLDDNEYDVINRRYLDVKNKRENKIKSYEKIAKDMHCSHTTAKRWHDSAIEKIVNYKNEKVGESVDIA